LAEVTVFVAEVFPPPQLKVAPAVVEDAFKVIAAVVQVKVAGGAILAFGTVMLRPTETEDEVVQPFDGSVTVTE
jgi:hypothetical protein